jgi:hypothetical protein
VGWLRSFGVFGVFLRVFWKKRVFYGGILMVKTWWNVSKTW